MSAHTIKYCQTNDDAQRCKERKEEEEDDGKNIDIGGHYLERKSFWIVIRFAAIAYHTSHYLALSHQFLYLIQLNSILKGNQIVERRRERERERKGRKTYRTNVVLYEFIRTARHIFFRCRMERKNTSQDSRLKIKLSERRVYRDPLILFYFLILEIEGTTKKKMFCRHLERCKWISLRFLIRLVVVCPTQTHTHIRRSPSDLYLLSFEIVIEVAAAVRVLQRNHGKLSRLL